MRIPSLAAAVSLMAIFLLFFIPSAKAAAIGICQYASASAATSQNSPNSMASYALGSPNAPLVGQCAQWSGAGYSWSPQNWDIVSNLTLKFNETVSASNITVFGDYDMCWRTMWLQNSETGEKRNIFWGNTNSCTYFQGNLSDFMADTLIIESCGWSWSSTDAVQLCGTVDLNDTNSTIPANSTNSSLKISRKVYLVPYLGDFDGSAPPYWYSFYDNMTYFHDVNNIPAGASFYPGTMVNNTAFSRSISKMYLSPDVELIQKGYNGSSIESNSHLASYSEQKYIADLGVGAFKAEMEKLGISNPRQPVVYNLLGGRFTNISMKATQDAGFNQYLDVYYDDNVGPTKSTPSYDVIQYGVSFTTDGRPGKDTTFKTAAQIYSDINNFARNDVQVKEINGAQVIPIWVHQQDFVNRAETGLNQSKWELYQDVMLMLSRDPNVTFISPSQSYALTHPEEAVPEICAWKDCKKGSASVSVDDADLSCMSKLEDNGFRGTYFLSYTDNLSQSTWNTLEQAFKNGHELGTHTRYHWCIATPNTYFVNDVELNIQDIMNHTSAERKDIVAHAYPCGFVNQNIMDNLENNASWNFILARGYNFNELENQTPVDMFNVKSLNSHRYPGGQLEPPPYNLSIDLAEQQGKWINLVFHSACDDDGSIKHLAERDIWTDTMGNVGRYIALRDAAKISDRSISGNTMSFVVSTNQSMRRDYYTQNLTLKVPADSGSISNVSIDGRQSEFTYRQVSGKSYALIELSFPINHNVTITFR